MTFKPINPKNAIQEAVFLVHFARPLSEAESEAIKRLHTDLKEELPKLTEQSSIQIMTGNQVPHGSPFEMTLFGPDGGIARRLGVNPLLLAVNELLYTRWEEVSKRAIRILSRALSAAVGASGSTGMLPLVVRAISLQVIDRFYWEGKSEAFAIEKALVRPFDRLPNAVWASKGPWMTSHTRFETLPMGNIVDRLDLTAAGFPPDPRLVVQIDNIVECQFAEPREPARLLASDSKQMHETFAVLHDRNKTMLRGLINEYLRKQIGIDHA